MSINVSNSIARAISKLEEIENEVKNTNDRSFCQKVFEICDHFRSKLNIYTPLVLISKLDDDWFAAHKRDNELWFEETSHNFNNAFEKANNAIDRAGINARKAIDLI